MDKIFIMNKMLKKSLSLSLTLLLIVQSGGFSYGQSLDLGKGKEQDNFNFNYLMHKGDTTKLDAWFSSYKPGNNIDYIGAADEILRLAANGGHEEEIAKLADANGEKFLEVIKSGKTAPGWETIYKSVGPYLLNEYVFSDMDVHTGMRAEYYKVYKQTLDKGGDLEAAGIALGALTGSSWDNIIKGEDIAGILKNNSYSEAERVMFLQYAAGYMAHRWGRVYFEDAIDYLRLRTWDTRDHITKGEFDPFLFYKAFDGVWRWGKTICSHRDGVWAGIKNCSESFDKEYVEVKAPKSVIDMGDSKVIANFYAARNLKEVNSGELLGALYRVYAGLFGGKYEWEDTYKSLYNRISFKKISEAHRIAALGELASNSDDSSLKKYTLGLVNNQYFDIKYDEDIGQEAGVLDDLGSVYGLLSGKKGAKIITLHNKGGFPYEIRTSGNIDEIEGFWSSLVNFSERPSQSLLNIWIGGALVKGAAKGVPAAVKALSKINVSNVLKNIPAIVSRSKRQYEALQYLAKRNQMGVFKYARANARYRTAAKVAGKGGLEMVEGVKSGEFFNSSYYRPGVHGTDIGRVGMDVKRASMLGLRGTGMGGEVPSYISQSRYSQGMSQYADDYVKGLSQETGIVPQSFFNKVSRVRSGGEFVKTGGDLSKAPFSLSRDMMYSNSDARYLSMVQDAQAVETYNTYDKVYKTIRSMGKDFINNLTGKSFGDILSFHPQGWMKQQGLIMGLTRGNAAGEAINNMNVLRPIERGAKILTFNPASYADISELVAVSGVKGVQNGLFMPAVLRTPFNPEDATFKIAAAGGFGSGFFVQKGNLDLPIVLTASHVAKNAPVVQLRDTYGRYSEGHVINIKSDSGFDLAAIIPEDADFLSGRIPFKLGLKDPEAGSLLMAHSYPDGDFYRTSLSKMMSLRYFDNSSSYPFYKIEIGQLAPGSSGGAVTIGDFDGTAIGTVMSGSDDGNVLLVPVSKMRIFFSETVKKLLFEPALRDKYLSRLPGLQSYYSNLLSRYSSGANINLSPAASTGITLPESRGFKLFSAPHADIKDLLNSSVFQVERGNIYGTATYVNYRGFDALITANHVIKGEGAIKIIAPSGKTVTAEIFARSPLSGGRDLAILIPADKNFLADYKPLELTHKAPFIGMPLFSAGYQNELFTFNEHKLVYDRFYINNGGRGGDLSFNVGYYGLSRATAKGNSGAPFVSDEGKIFGISSAIHEARDLSLAVRYSVIKDFMRNTLINKFRDPYFDFDSFSANYPALADNYSNVIGRFRDMSGASSRASYIENEASGLSSGSAEPESLTQVSSLKPMSENKKNFLFWLNTKIFRSSPKSVLQSLYQKGALPRVYIPLKYTGEDYFLSSLEPYRVVKKNADLYSPFPFTNVRAYAHRGMSLSEKDLLNIMDNGLRKIDMPDQNLAILAPQVTPGTKLQAISFSPYAAVSARYSATSISEEKPFPIMVDVTGIGPKTAHVNVHGMFTGLDIPPERIKKYHALLNIEGSERWGELIRNPKGGFNFKPYQTSVAVPPGTNASLFWKEGNNIADAPDNTFKPSELKKHGDITDLSAVEASDGYLRCVWRARDAQGETVGYLKYGTKEEIERTLHLEGLIKENNLADKYDLLDIEYSSLLSEDISSVPPQMRAKVKEEFTQMRKRNPRFYEYDTPFILNDVDTSGFTMTSAKAEDISLLNNIPISDKEWLQIVDFYKTLNKMGFYHSDIFGNLHLRRLPNGKLKMTILDYELYSALDMPALSKFESTLRSLGLKEDITTALYYDNLSDINAPQKIGFAGIKETAAVSGSKGYTLDAKAVSSYAASVEEVRNLPFTNLEKYFMQDNVYYRGMRLTVDEIVKISNNGLLLKDTSPRSDISASIALGKDVQGLFFSEDIGLAADYAASNIKNGSSKIAVIAKVKSFKPDISYSKNPLDGLPLRRDLPASEILGFTAAINVDGAVKWGDLKVQGNSVIFKPYEDAAAAEADILETEPVSAVKPYEINIEDTKAYGMDFDTAFEIDSSLLEANFAGNKSYYRGMALNLKDILKISKEGLLLKDTKPGSDMYQSNLQKRDVRSIFFYDAIAIAQRYAISNLEDNASTIPVIVKVRSFVPDNGRFSREQGMSIKNDVPASDIVGIAAALNINGRPQWGDIEIADGKIFFKPYSVFGGGLQYSSSANISEIMQVSGVKKNFDAEVVKEYLKPFRLNVPQTALDYAETLSGAKAAIFKDIIDRTRKFSDRINQILEDRKSYQTMPIWNRNELNNESGNLIRILKDNFDIDNPAVEDLIEELYGVREALYPANRGLFKQKYLKYRDASGLGMDRFLGKLDVFINKEKYASAVKDYFKPGDIIAVANDDSYILDFFEKLTEDGYFGPGVTVKKYIDANSVLTDIAAGLKPKILVSDITLDGGGIFTAGILRKAGFTDMPIFAISGFTENSERNKILYSVGFDGYISRVNTRVDMMSYLMTGERSEDFENQFSALLYNYMEDNGLLKEAQTQEAPGVPVGLFGPRYN